MKKQHVHKLPTYRHPVTRCRAIVSHVWGTKNTFSIDVFDYKKRLGVCVLTAHKAEIEGYLVARGYK